MFIFVELRRNATNLIHVHTKVEQVFSCHRAALDPRGGEVTVSVEPARLKIDSFISILRNDRCQTFFKKGTDQEGDD